MATGALGNYMDLTQLLLYAFWIFFAGLIIYLRREDKREGYPLESDRSDRVVVQGFPAIPDAKVFLLADGSTREAPRAEAPEPEIAAKPSAPWPGAPLVPTGNPMRDGVGPASYARRADVPDVTAEGHVKIVPMRKAAQYTVSSRDPDPRGMSVIGADDKTAGTVVDIWVDTGESMIRYLEVEVPTAEGAKRVLLPNGFASVSRWQQENRVTVTSIMSTQFADVPALQNPDQVTLREEDRICAYYAGGDLYAEPSRQEPLL